LLTHAGERENGVVGKPPRPGARKKRDLKGKKLFDKDSSSGEDEETPPASESEDAAEEEEEDDDDDNTPLFHIRQTLHQPASMAGNSHLKPPPTAVKAQKPERSKRRDEGTPSLIRSAEEDEDTDTDDVLQTARRDSVVPDEPGLIGSATEEQLPANIGQDHQTKHVATTGTFLLEESTKVGILPIFSCLQLSDTSSSSHRYSDVIISVLCGQPTFLNEVFLTFLEWCIVTELYTATIKIQGNIYREHLWSCLI
jgi:hypothetical protein